jgi:hypothetical protein
MSTADVAYGVTTLTGFVDPTPISDGYQAVYDYQQGDYGGAALSVVGAVVPFVPAAVVKGAVKVIKNVVGGGGDVAKKSPVKKWEVGDYDDLVSRSTPGDGLQIHHAPQGHPAQQVINGYDYKTGSAIAVPDQTHFKINGENVTGQYQGTSQQLLKKTEKDLIKNKVPQKSVKQLKKLWNEKNYE